MDAITSPRSRAWRRRREWCPRATGSTCDRKTTGGRRAALLGRGNANSANCR